MLPNRHEFLRMATPVQSSNRLLPLKYKLHLHSNIMAGSASNTILDDKSKRHSDVC
jgi:hypothetical protein